MDRTRAQVRLGVSESSQLEHMATRLVYLDVHDQRDVPERFHYIGQSSLYMYRTQTYSEDEHIDDLKRHPKHNLLMTNNGVVEVSIHEPGRHLDFIKNEKEQATSEMVRISASSQKRQKPEMRQKGRRNRPMGKPPQRKAPSVRLPELPEELQPHLKQQAVAAALKSLHSKLVSRLVNGSDGTESGTRRSTGTDVPSGRRAR